MELTTKNIRKAIKELKSSVTTIPDNYVAWVHPRYYFKLTNKKLCLQAYKLNEKHGKDIWDKRTKGWKLIEHEYSLMSI